MRFHHRRDVYIHRQALKWAMLEGHNLQNASSCVGKTIGQYALVSEGCKPHRSEVLKFEPTETTTVAVLTSVSFAASEKYYRSKASCLYSCLYS